jgi:hypothetical protein
MSESRKLQGSSGIRHGQGDEALPELNLEAAQPNPIDYRKGQSPRPALV